MKPLTKSSGPWLLAMLLFASAATTLLGPQVGCRLRGMVHWAFAPMGDAGMYLTTSLKRQTRPAPPAVPHETGQLRETNEQLRRRVHTLASELMLRRRATRGGEAIFSRLFSPGQDVPVRLIPARVVAADSLPYGWTRIVNAGEKHGAEKKMYVTERRLLIDRSAELPERLAVLSAAGLVGRLMETGPFTARLQLVVDRGFEAPAQIQRILHHGPSKRRMIRSGVRLDRQERLSRRNNHPLETIARGDGAGRLVIREVRKAHNVRAGDVLQTRPDSGSLPVAVDIGTIVEITDDPRHAGMVTLRIRPSADLPSLREVYIVVPGMGKLPSPRRR